MTVFQEHGFELFQLRQPFLADMDRGMTEQALDEGPQVEQDDGHQDGRDGGPERILHDPADGIELALGGVGPDVGRRAAVGSVASGRGRRGTRFISLAGGRGGLGGFYKQSSSQMVSSWTHNRRSNSGSPSISSSLPLEGNSSGCSLMYLRKFLASKSFHFCCPVSACPFIVPARVKPRRQPRDPALDVITRQENRNLLLSMLFPVHST